MMEDWNDELLNLLEKKEFSKLTPAERELVLAYMTEEEYTRQHQLITETQIALKSDQNLLTPDPEILAGLQRKTRKRKAGVFTFQVPVYQPLLAFAAILILALFFWPNPETQVLEKERIVYETKTDTVFIDKIVEVPVIERYAVRDTVFIGKNETEMIFTQEDLIAEGLTPESNVELENLDRNFGNTNLDSKQLNSLMLGMN